MVWVVIDTNVLVSALRSTPRFDGDHRRERHHLTSDFGSVLFR
ncbi:MAG: hypothetical protein ABSH56_37160 [Bryobacteraceae bacterium]|jgi:hypothetical protein